MSTTRNSAQWLALRLLAYEGVTSFSTSAASNDPDNNNPGLQANTLEDIAGVITAGLQELFDDAPNVINEQRLACNLHAPTTLTLTMTADSANCVVTSGWASWMLGCRVNIAGDGFLNEIVGYTSAGTVVALLRPFGGSSGSGVSATVYQDAIRLDSNGISNLASGLAVQNVIDPVELVGRRLLIPDGTREVFYARGGILPYSGDAIIVNEPTHYFVDSRYDPTASVLPLYLRIAPAPGQFWPIVFRARVYPLQITVANLGDDTTDPGVMFPIPSGIIESILLPYCLQRLTGHSAFRNDSAKAEIARQFASAKNRLQSLVPGVGNTQGVAYPLGGL